MKPLETKVTVEFHRETTTDPYTHDDFSFLEGSYLDVADPVERQRYLDSDAERMAAYRRGDWHFIGIRAKAIVWVSHGVFGYCTNYALESVGLYGIESDSGEEYLQEVFKEECDSLLADIRAFGSATVRS